MFSLSKIFTAILALSLSSLTAASPAPVDDVLTYGHPLPKTCAPSPFTTHFVTTKPTVITMTSYIQVTVPTTAFITHSCFSYTSIISQSDNAFCGTFNPATCGPHPLCLLLTTTTIPCKDPCCLTTPTVTTLGGCVSCQKGCGTVTETVTATGCPTG